MTPKMKLMTSVGALFVSCDFAAAAPAVVANSVNLRAGPGADSQIIAALPSGAVVDVMGCGPAWCRVAFRGAIGFASRGYLQLGAAAIAAPYRGYGEGYA